MPGQKTKLRTASDVLSRLRWSAEEDCTSVMMGYDDRINGPMEKCVDDYKPIDEGGDIPEHRIQYFRKVETGASMDQTIVWDREGRVDRIFGSGNGARAPVAPATVQRATDAIINMKRLADENEIRKQERAKRRARRLRERKSHPTSGGIGQPEHAVAPRPGETGVMDDRHKWSAVASYVFSASESAWVKYTATKSRSDEVSVDKSSKLQVVTWNVLFDKFLDEIVLWDGDSSDERWVLAIRYLSETNADIIGLQEVTPRFAELLCGSPWVQSNYSVSTCPRDYSTVDPHGNMFLWKRERLQTISFDFGLALLGDGHRNRSIVACLQRLEDPKSVFICGNVHLPADATSDEGENLSRAIARKRELNTVLAKMQVMEESLALGTGKMVCAPIVLGDFNTDAKTFELEDGCFAGSSLQRGIRFDGFFADAWTIACRGQPGHTSDPDNNPRAAISKKGPRRIDRIFAGLDSLEEEGRGLRLSPVEGRLIGTSADDEGTVPPSDHYGLSVVFDVQRKAALARRDQYRNAWAATAVPSTDTLLALKLETPNLNMALFDPDSSLPVTHITLLNGFAELSSAESRTLALQTVTDAVKTVLASTNECAVPFNKDALSVFEHRSSASLVCVPDYGCKEGQWLQILYDVLRGAFRRCDEQEIRFQEGWTPHGKPYLSPSAVCLLRQTNKRASLTTEFLPPVVTLKRFGTADAARTDANNMRSDGSWISMLLRAEAVVVYQRDPIDRKYYAVSAVPLVLAPPNPLTCRAKVFLRDAATSLSGHFSFASAPFLSNIERVCHATIESQSQGQLQAVLRAYGSGAFNASLPSISDVDVVVEIRAKTLCDGSKADQPVSRLSSSAFLQNIGLRLKSIHPRAKMRMRVAGAAGVALHFLTIKLEKGAPSVDLIVSLKKANGEPAGISGAAANDSIDDCRLVLDGIHAQTSSLQLPLDVVEVFEGALRLCKLWAFRRQIYGAPLGFLGGGGWAVLLARTMCDGLREGALRLADTAAGGEVLSVEGAAIHVLSHFFEIMERSWKNSVVIGFPPGENGTLGPAESSLDEETAEKVLARGTMAVLAPASGGNFARNLTRSTAQTILQEFRRAAIILENSKKDGPSDLEIVFRPISQHEILAGASSVLTIEIDTEGLAACSGSPPLPEVKAWASCQMLRVLVALEKELGDATLIRPLSRPVRAGRVLFFVIRVNTPEAAISGFVQKLWGDIEFDLQGFLDEAGGGIKAGCFQMRCLASPQFASSVEANKQVSGK
jgi:endonuclease/exonuclease/phosphatase family metal-dependent hydrolase